MPKTDAEGVKSDADVAATLFMTSKPKDAPTDAERSLVTQSPAGGDEDDIEADAEGQDEDDVSIYDDGEEVDAEDTDDDQESDNDEDNEAEYVDIRDDDLIAVMVDGEEQEVSIADLKKRFSAEGTHEKRVQQATELRNRTTAEASQLLDKMAQRQAVLDQAFNGFQDTDFIKPLIPVPDERLRQTNPQQYLRHQEAYQADQSRIQEARAALSAEFQRLQEAREESLQEYSKFAVKQLGEYLPDLLDQKKAPPLFRAMAETAKNYGYNDAEIQSAMDPRMFRLVHDAMKYRELVQTTKGRDVKDLSDQTQKKVRRLRSGNTTAKTRSVTAQKQREQVRAKAQQTGKVQDVAATLIR